MLGYRFGRHVLIFAISWYDSKYTDAATTFLELQLL